jgi:hypothetical protein
MSNCDSSSTRRANQHRGHIHTVYRLHGLLLSANSLRIFAHLEPEKSAFEQVRQDWPSNKSVLTAIPTFTLWIL